MRRFIWPALLLACFILAATALGQAQPLPSESLTQEQGMALLDVWEVPIPPEFPRFPAILSASTYGLPNGTTAEAVLAAADRAKAEGVIIYTIGLGGDVDPHLLQQVATDPGKYYFAPRATDLEAIYEQIAFVIPCG